jgi:hypothetical protein
MTSTDPDRPADALTSSALTEHLLTWPDLSVMVADEASGAPPVSWGDRFFYVGDDPNRYVATIVEHDVPGYDEASQLDRPGAYRFNVELGRRQFERELGYPPSQVAEHESEIDFSRQDVVLPHPIYGRQGWACIVAPTRRRLADIDRLVTLALKRRRQRGAAS